VQRTPLYNFHTQHDAKIVDFAGWALPILYTGIVEEHNYTRQVAGAFDISHMGRIELRGDDAEALLERVCTRKLADSEVGQSRYSQVCNEQGGILDDVIVSRYEDRWLVVCNASNREKIVVWLEDHTDDLDVRIEDKTESTLMVAVQGPVAVPALSGKLNSAISDLKRYRFMVGTHMFVSYTVFRSGYTGEDGVEVIAPAMVAPMLGGFLTGSKPDRPGPKPAGLGARDTLRLEAGMPLYGHELSEDIDPLSAGQSWCVDLTKDFIGSDALRAIAEKGPARRLVGLELEGKRIARQEARVLNGESAVGQVTSGTLSPTLHKSIAMAYVESSLSDVGQTLTVDLGQHRSQAIVVQLPFYKRGGDQK